MVTSDVICRVLRIVVGANSGSAFTMEHDKTQYLITAKHLFESMHYPTDATIQVRRSNYEKYDVEIRYPSSGTVDIAVMRLKPYHMLTNAYDNENSSTGMTLGQDVYFLGFPYDYDQWVQQSPLSNTPVPFIKKACLSSVIKSNDDIMLMLDGHNNPGFSGGPVCFQSNSNKKMSIAGVISGYRYSKQPVMDNKGIPQNLYWKENTGIVVSYSIKHAVDVIEQWK